MNRLIDSIRRVRRTFRPIEPDGDPGPDLELEGRRVLLVYLFDALGDVALLGPVIAALTRGGAKGKIGVVATANGARVLKLLDLPIDAHVLPEALALPPEDPDDRASKRAWRTPEVQEAVAAYTKKLAAKRYDIAVDLTYRAHADGRRWLAASGAEVTLGWTAMGNAPQDGLTWGTEDGRHLADRHWSRLQTLPLRGLGIRGPDYDLGFKVTERAEEKAADAFGPGPRVLLVPGGRDPNKHWAPERFERVGQWVVQEAEGTVVVLGAPNEAKLVKQLVKAIGPGAKAYTQKDLGGMVALVKHAHAVVTNDTGPMHFAFLAKTPTVAIFTWMSPVCWGPPITDPKHVVLRIPDEPGPDAEGIYTRAAIHYLDGLLAKFGPCAR